MPKLGAVKIRMSRPLQGDPKEVTIVKKASGWYAHISCDIGDTPKGEPTRAIAVDVGTTHYLTTSAGEKVENPRWYRKAQGLLNKHQKCLSRRVKGSMRWRKAKHKVAMHHEHIFNKRRDFIGKLVYKLFHHQKIMSSLQKHSTSQIWSRINTSVKVSAMRLGQSSFNGVQT